MTAPDVLYGGADIGWQSAVEGDAFRWTFTVTSESVGPLDMTLFGSQWRAHFLGYEQGLTVEIDESAAADGALTLTLTGEQTSHLATSAEASTYDVQIAPAVAGLIAFRPFIAHFTAWRRS
jgi:hypothetical protein